MLLIIIFALLLIGFIGMYNTLVNRRNEAENAFGSIDAMLKKRYDLIPNLVVTVKEYAGHEYNTLAKIVEMRSKPYDQFSTEDKGVLDREFTRASRSVFLLAENYPQLRASENFMQLQRTLNEVEEQLSASRRTYNAAITSYNNAVENFPSNMIAGMFRFSRKMVLEIPEEERKNVDVKALFNR